MQGKAVVFTDRRQVAFQEVQIPDPGPRDVVVRTTVSWISNGTEGSFLRGERLNGETPWKEGMPWPFPLVAGYQSVGVVESVGAEAGQFRPGQMVFCTMGKVEGMYEPWGGQISPKVADVSQVWAIPEGVQPEAVSGLVLTQVGYNCGIRPPVDKDTVALVLGDGMVGHWAAQTLHLRGAKVILAGKHDERLACFPADDRRLRLNITSEPLADGVKRLAPAGIDILVDTVGSVATVMELHPQLRHNGHIVSAGYNGEDSMVDVQRLRFGEITWHSPSGWDPARMDATLALIASGDLQTLPLVTHRFPVERAADAWKLILDRTEHVLGVLLDWE
jgi:bacteriochlorophyllide a dehydrogenase